MDWKDKGEMKEEEKAILMELIFCINSPQTKYVNNIRGEELRQLVDNLSTYSIEELAKIYKSRIRFHNNKARYCIEAYDKFPQILIVLDWGGTPKRKREWLVKHIKGLSYKEASHFLRNIGRDNGELAILDTHILKYFNYPKSYVPSRKEYLKLERVFVEEAKTLGISAGELDIKLWEKYRSK